MKRVAVDEELEIPKDVTLSLNEAKEITVKGKQGTITKNFGHAKAVQISVLDNKIYFHADFPRNREIAIVSTFKNLVNNMILGVQQGYEYRMKIVYSHFPITLEPPKKGKTEILIKNFLGERAPRITHSIGDVKIKANKEEVIVTGPDKESVAQTCASIQKRCRIKEKDKRIFQDGIYVFEKILGKDHQLWVIK